MVMQLHYYVNIIYIQQVITFSGASDIALRLEVSPEDSQL
jgi:hypothetical protein